MYETECVVSGEKSANRHNWRSRAKALVDNAEVLVSQVGLRDARRLVRKVVPKEKSIEIEESGVNPASDISRGM